MLYTEQLAKWGFNDTNISHKAQTILLARLKTTEGWAKEP